MIRRISAGAFTVLASIATAGDLPALPPDCEAALALSAAPAHVQSGASVYVLTDEGYRLHRKGDNPFTCIVQHTPARSLIPICFDSAGTEAIVPAILREGEMIVAGHAVDDARRAVRDDIHGGHFAAPVRPGVAYMVSDYNLRYFESIQELRRIPPHVMFYAPDVSDADIGGSLAAANDNPGLPFVVDEGPHGYMIVWTDHGSDSSNVAESCGAAVPDPAAVPTFGSQ